MKVLYFKGQNFKKLDVVEIRPEGHLVAIKGNNGNGKTSVLDGLWTSLAGKAVAPIEPIKQGQELARLETHLGDGEVVKFIVVRTFKRVLEEDKTDTGEYTTDLKITDGEGLPYTKKLQTMLEGFYGALTFDALEFTRMDDAEQFALLGSKFVPDIDFDRLERQYDADYEKRKDVNARAKTARTLVNTTVVPDEPPCEAADEAALLQELTEAATFNEGQAQKAANRKKLADEGVELRAEAATLRERAKKLREQADAADVLAGGKETAAVAIETRLASLKALAPSKDIQALSAQVREAQEANRQIAEWQADVRRKTELAANATALELESKAITKRMDDREADKNVKIAAAKMPVPGLGFGKKCVTLDNVPLSQASDAQRLIAAVGIAMAMSPELRILRIRDGSLLDPSSLALVTRMAEERDYDVWIEIVGEDGPAGFILEDGHIKGTAVVPDPDFVGATSKKVKPTVGSKGSGKPF